MVNERADARWLWCVLVLLLVIFSTTTCAVKLVSDYDEVLDKYTTELQAKTESFLLKMHAAAGTPQGEYASNKAFYEEASVALSAMRLRAESIPKNDITVEQIGELEKNFENLRKLHESAGASGLSKTMIETSRTLLNVQFKAILTLELAKKRGQS